MNRSIKRIILGVILLIASIYSLVAISSQIFNDSFRNGQTLIRLELLDEVNKDEIKAVVASSINIEKSGIKIADGEEDLVIKLDLLDSKDINLIKTSLLNDFAGRLEFTRHSTIGKSSNFNYPGVFLVYIVLILSFFLSLYIIFTNMKSLISRRAYFRNQA